MAQWTQIVLFSAAAVGVLFAAVSLLIVYRAKEKQTSSLRPSAELPGVTIFKPLKGVDESLEANLTTFFRLDHPRYELLFGVSDANDPAIPLVERLIRRYPEIPARLVVSARRFGHNPKVNNLCNLASFARHGLWVISDSNVAVSEDYLRDLTTHMQQPHVGLVTSLIRGVGGGTVGACLENLHLNGFIAGSTLAVSQLLRIPVSIGKSMMLRRETVEQLGGFEAFADYLLEDGLIGREVRRLGYRTATTFNAVENVNRGWPLKSFFSRHLRWAVMRRQLNVLHYGAELVSNPIALSVLALAVSPTMPAAMIAAAVWLTKILLELMTIRLVGGRADFLSAALLPLKDLIVGAIWPLPFFTNRVHWRGNILRVGKMTRATLVDSSNRKTPVKTGVKTPWRRVWTRPLLLRKLRFVFAEERN